MFRASRSIRVESNSPDSCKMSLDGLIILNVCRRDQTTMTALCTASLGTLFYDYGYGLVVWRGRVVLGEPKKMVFDLSSIYLKIILAFIK